MKPKTHKPEVGQTIYALNVGNAAWHTEQKLTPYVVVKVGRKYFTVRESTDNNGWSDKQFHIDGWRQKTDYSTDMRLYESAQDWYDDVERKKISNELSTLFRHGQSNLSLTTLRKIKVIIENDSHLK